MPVRSESASDINEEEHEHIPAEMIENIQHKLLIRSIERRLFTIEQCYFNPQILTIEGYDRLRNLPGQQHWKSKIFTLFSDAYLPHHWILDIWKSRLADADERVYVQLITFQTKMFVKSVLTQHFLDEYDANVNVYD